MVFLLFDFFVLQYFCTENYIKCQQKMFFF